MQRLFRIFKAGVATLLIVAVGLAVLTILTARPSDPRLYPPQPGTAIVGIHVVDHGYHAALILPTSDIARVASEARLPALSDVVQRFAVYEWIEIGWGDDNFYRNVPDASLDNLHHVLRALLLPGNASVLHVVGFDSAPEVAFPRSGHLALRLSNAGFVNLLRGVDATFAEADGRIVDAGGGLYGPSRFFGAKGSYSLLNLCNHWVGEMLHAAGLAYAPLSATLSRGLLLDIAWRSLPDSNL